MSAFDDEVSRAAQRLASRSRRNAGDEAWLVIELNREAARLERLAEASAFSAHRLEYGTETSGELIPINLAACDAHLADELEQGFIRALAVLSGLDAFRGSGQWTMQAQRLALEAAQRFRSRGRYILAAEICRMAANAARDAGMTSVSDRLNVRAEDYVTESLAPAKRSTRWLSRLVALYGFDPLRVFLAAIVVIVAVTAGIITFGGVRWDHALSLAVGDYITLGGAPEYATLGTVARLVLSIEAFIAIVLNGFFITLLARRLFRV